MDSSVEISLRKHISDFVNKNNKKQINNSKNISNSSEISDKIKKYKTKNIKYMTSKLMNLPKLNKSTEKNKNQCNFTKKLKFFYHKSNMIKSNSTSSYTTTFYYNTQKECKIKTVTFSTVEIIRVKSYKKYNASISKSPLEENRDEKGNENKGSSLCNMF